VRVETWGVQADNVVRYCGKGRMIAVEGHLHGRFLTADGDTRGGRLRLVVVAERITYLERPAQHDGAGTDADADADEAASDG